MITDCRLFIGKVSQDWYVEYRINGKRKRIFEGSKFGMIKEGNNIKDIKERKAYFKKLYNVAQDSLAKNNAPPKPLINTTLSAAAQHALQIKQKRATKVSYNTFRVAVNRFVLASPDTLISQITTIFISNYLHELNIELAQTHNSYRSEISNFFSILVETGYCAKNPVTDVHKMKVVSASTNVAYTDAELKLVFKTCEEYSCNLYLISCFMFAAFLRPIEIIKLQRKHIDFEKNIIAVPAHLRKSNDYFTIGLTEQLKLDLIKYGKNTLLPEEYIITSTTTGKQLPESYYSMMFLKMKTRYKLKFKKGQSLYSIRHTAAIKFFLKTNNLKLLSTLMGHKSVNTTIIYLRSLGMIIGDVSSDMLLEY